MTKLVTFRRFFISVLNVTFLYEEIMKITVLSALSLLGLMAGIALYSSHNIGNGQRVERTQVTTNGISPSVVSSGSPYTAGGSGGSIEDNPFVVVLTVAVIASLTLGFWKHHQIHEDRNVAAKKHSVSTLKVHR
jgi:hypothetical protein